MAEVGGRKRALGLVTSARTVNAEKLAEKMQDMAELVAQMDEKELQGFFSGGSGWGRP